MSNTFTPSERQLRFIEVFNDAKERHQLTNKDMEKILDVKAAQLSMALGINPVRGIHVKHMDRFLQHFKEYSPLYVYEGKGDMYVSDKDKIIDALNRTIEMQEAEIARLRQELLKLK